VGVYICGFCIVCMYICVDVCVYNVRVFVWVGFVMCECVYVWILYCVVRCMCGYV